MRIVRKGFGELISLAADGNFKLMQLTIEIPDELARQLEPERERIAEVIQRGLAQLNSSDSAIAQEVIEFLGRGPGPREIIGFRPSADSIRRADELLALFP